MPPGGTKNESLHNDSILHHIKGTLDKQKPVLFNKLHKLCCLIVFFKAQIGLIFYSDADPSATHGPWFLKFGNLMDRQAKIYMCYFQIFNLSADSADLQEFWQWAWLLYSSEASQQSVKRNRRNQPITHRDRGTHNITATKPSSISSSFHQYIIFGSDTMLKTGD